MANGLAMAQSAVDASHWFPVRSRTVEHNQSSVSQVGRVVSEVIRAGYEGPGPGPAMTLGSGL